jgi:hypothetical protein
MRTIETKVYHFSELSEEAKEKAIQAYFDINVSHEWWEFIFMDAEQIGLKITGFDLDRNKHCTGKLIHSASEVSNLILKNHGETCETYKLAENFISEWDYLVEKFSDGIDKTRVSEENEWEFDNEADELEAEFLKDLLEEYASILQKAYEYLTSEEAIQETIEANGYEFTEAGKIF